MARKPQLSDVAELAGVSVATVDRVLNRRGGVKPEREAAVLVAARRLKVDRNLSHRYAKLLRIAVLIQSPINPFHEALRDAFANASRACADLNLQFLIHHISPGDARGIAKAVNEASRRHDGLIVSSPADARIAAALREASRKLPVVTLATDLPDSGRAAYVGPDDRQAGRVAGDLMGRFLGPSGGDVAMIAGLLSVVGQRAREMGFREVLAEHYPRCRLAAVYESGESAATAGLLALQARNEYRELRGLYHSTAGAPEIVAALESAPGPRTVAIVTHELTAERRALLARRAIDAVIDQRPDCEAHAATEVMARLLGRLDGEARDVVTPVQIFTPENI